MSENLAVKQPEEGTSKRDKLVKIIGSMLDKVEKAGGLTRESVFQELVDLKKVIEDSRREIGMARPGDIRTKDIPTATDELDAVVEATAQATATIMDACDGIQTAAGELGKGYKMMNARKGILIDLAITGSYNGNLLIDGEYGRFKY